MKQHTDWNKLHRDELEQLRACIDTHEVIPRKGKRLMIETLQLKMLSNLFLFPVINELGSISVSQTEWC